MRLPGRLALFSVGVLVGGASVGLLLRAELGVSSYDVLNSGLAGTIGIPVGTASWIVSAAAILIAVALGRRPGPGTIVSMVGFGAMINLVLARVDTPASLAVRGVWLAGALVGLWTGIALTVVARLGANPPEELMLGLVGRGLSVRAARWGIEAVFLAIGVALGGQVGLGTVIIAACTAPVLGLVLPPLERRLHEPVHVEIFPAP
ncbi:MAG: YczE/YyaS/YitT family protein [Actinomycetes bacterium]